MKKEAMLTMLAATLLGGASLGQAQVQPAPAPANAPAPAPGNFGRPGGGGFGGRMAVGDPGASDPLVYGGGIRQPAAPGVPGANVELKSDPMGVDFRAYLAQVLAAVRRNWTAVMPESVRLGLRGHVSIQFAIGRNGDVLKLVYAAQSGSRPLDEAAVAGISCVRPSAPTGDCARGSRADSSRIRACSKSAGNAARVATSVISGRNASG